MELNLSAIERIAKYAKSFGSQNVTKFEPSLLKGINPAELKLAILGKDTVNLSGKGLLVSSYDLDGLIKLDGPLKVKTDSVGGNLDPIFKAKSVMSNPFALELKSEYMIFREKVDEEVKLVTRSMNDRFLKRINPINSNNIEHIKSELKSFMKDINPEVEQKILNSNNPNEVFKLIKENSQRISSDKYSNQWRLLKKEAILSGVTPKLENEYRTLKSNIKERTRKLINLLTPKSVNSEVLKIEKEVRKLGIKAVNFSDDLEQAKLVKESMEDLIKNGIPLPHSITITPFLPTGMGGMAINENIYLTTTSERLFTKKLDENVDILIKNISKYKKAPIEYQEKYINAIKDLNDSHCSSINLKHTIYHETAHTFEPNSLAAELRKLTPKEMKTAGEISMYAKKLLNGKEAMTEMFSKLMDGQTLTDNQMALYLKLGGIVPKF